MPSPIWSDVVDKKNAALSRSKMLAKEIDHRVMNSLQQVSALLNLQSRDLGESEAGQQLMLAASRVSAVARVHQHIYQSDDTKSFGCLGYLGRLCDDLSSIMGESGKIVVGGSEAELPVEAIPPIGLAVNELVTNAAKYGANASFTSPSSAPAMAIICCRSRTTAKACRLRSTPKRARDWA